MTHTKKMRENRLRKQFEKQAIELLLRKPSIDRYLDECKRIAKELGLNLSISFDNNKRFGTPIIKTDLASDGNPVFNIIKMDKYMVLYRDKLAFDKSHNDWYKYYGMDKSDNDYWLEKAMEYCDNMGFDYQTENDAYEKINSFYIDGMSKIYGNFTPEIVENTFVNCAYNTTKEIIDTIGKENNTLYSLLGDCSGILVFSDYATLYYISKSGAFLHNYYFNDINDLYNFSIVAQISDDYLNEKADKEFRKYFDNAVAVLLYKKYCNVKEEIITAQEKDEISPKSNTNKKSYPFKIKKLDKTWDTTIIVKGIIKVRGFWRFQACGENWSERKLTFVKSHVKRHYIRKAKKLKEYPNAA